MLNRFERATAVELGRFRENEWTPTVAKVRATAIRLATLTSDPFAFIDLTGFQLRPEEEADLAAEVASVEHCDER